jgi:hypothetical protein
MGSANLSGSFFKRRDRLVCVCLLAVLTIILASCGGAASHTGSSGPAPTASLTITPSTIVSGVPISFTWSATNAESGTIDNGVGNVGIGPHTTTYTAGEVGYPTGTTTYTYTVTGPGGTATATAIVTVNLVTSFDGMVQSEGTQLQDVDANGAVGQKQYLEYVNSAIQAYDKGSGAAIWQTPIPIQNLWANNPPCYISSGGTPYIQLDVAIAYDKLAGLGNTANGRWIIAAHTSNQTAYYLCLAVSSGDDLTTATWGAYSFQLQNPSNPVMPTGFQPDWPRLGIWPNGYYVAFDTINIAANQEEGTVVCAFDRPDILNNPGSILPAACVNISTSPNLDLGHSLIPADFDGTTAPPGNRDEFMVSIQNPPDDGVTLTSNALNLWDFQLVWGATSGTLTYTQQQITVPAYTPGCYLYAPGNATLTNCVLEPPNGGQTQIVDSVGDRLMPRFAYRNFGNYESYLVSQTVQTGPGSTGNTPMAYQTGIQWYEMRYSGSPNNTLVLNQSGTINPDSTTFRFLPSIAQDKVGNAAAGYSTSGPLGDEFPGIDFSYWSLTSQTATTEVPIFQGEGEELSPSNNNVGKWGSYSSMTIDPFDDCTFWYVNEYFFSDNTWRTRIANFAVPGCLSQ